MIQVDFNPKSEIDKTKNRRAEENLGDYRISRILEISNRLGGLEGKARLICGRYCF